MKTKTISEKVRDELVRNPFATNADLAAKVGCSVSYAGTIAAPLRSQLRSHPGLSQAAGALLSHVGPGVVDISAHTEMSFEDLDDDAKETARREWRHNFDTHGDDHVVFVIEDDFASIVDEYGIPYGKDGLSTDFSLGCSQGDGVGFVGRINDVSTIAKPAEGTMWERFPDFPKPPADDEVDYLDLDAGGSTYFSDHHLLVSWAEDIDTAGSYDENYEWVEHTPEQVADIAAKLDRRDAYRDELRGFFYVLSKQLEKNGYEEIEYRQSDEYIDEMLGDDSGYTFSPSGSWR